MALMSQDERRTAEGVSQLMYCNPFLPERKELERAILGNTGSADGVWSKRSADPKLSPAVTAIAGVVEKLIDELRTKVKDKPPADADLTLYTDVCLYLLFDRYRAELQLLITASQGKPVRKCTFVKAYLADFERLLGDTGVADRLGLDAAHLLACFFQVRRAFYFTYECIIGGSMPTAVLRAAVWQSIFTCDMRRYQHALYDKLGDITTLVVGPSGTGKELVAQAIAMSRYIAFDIEAGAFAGDFAKWYFPLNLSALSPTLIESELFGHRRGAYTGALEDREGWLEVCPPLGSVFLDEIGEINDAIQVKLLRVLESRVFQRLGETESRQFNGKLIAATNRDLAREMDAGNFRTDLYYRLCSDIIHTPSLHEQLQDMPGELEILVRFLALRVAGEEVVEALTSEVVEWIDANLGAEYEWRGNVRELEQCVRNIMIRRDYRPAQRSADTPHQKLANDMAAGGLTADELLSRYCTIVYAQTGSYEAAARQLELDRRTVKSKIDETLLKQLKDKR